MHLVRSVTKKVESFSRRNPGIDLLSPSDKSSSVLKRTPRAESPPPLIPADDDAGGGGNGDDSRFKNSQEKIPSSKPLKPAKDSGIFPALINLFFVSVGTSLIFHQTELLEDLTYKGLITGTADFFTASFATLSGTNFLAAYAEPSEKPREEIIYI